jgi:hypothetical protein
LLRDHIEEVAAFSSDAWSPLQFLEQNKFAWSAFHSELKVRNGASFSAQMPYLMQSAMDVVVDEKPSLFPEHTDPVHGTLAFSQSMPTQTATAVPTVAVSSIQSGFAREVASLAAGARSAHVEQAVLSVVRELAGASAASFTAETPLMDAGVDSLAATEFSLRLRKLTGMVISPVIVFEQPTPHAIAMHVLEQLGTQSTASMKPLVAQTSSAGASFALMSGMVGRWPGGCNRDVARSALQTACGDAMGGVPLARWVLSEAVDVSRLSRVQAASVCYGGFVSGAQLFDESAFHISRVVLL